jgi:hypothetical protein
MNMRFLRYVIVEISVLFIVTACNLVCGYRYFGGMR